MCGESGEVGGLFCSWSVWTAKCESRLRRVLILKKSNRKVNTKMSIDLPLNPNIFILGDFDSITNISKDQGHFILRASLIGKKLILQKWKSAKEIKIDMRSTVEVPDPLGFFPHMSQTSVFKGLLVSSKFQATLPACPSKSSQPFPCTFYLRCSCRSFSPLRSMLFWRQKMLSATYLDHQEKQGNVAPICYFSCPFTEVHFVYFCCLWQ